MNRHSRAVTVLAALVVWLPGRANGQAGGPSPPPAASPGGGTNQFVGNPFAGVNLNYQVGMGQSNLYSNLTNPALSQTPVLQTIVQPLLENRGSTQQQQNQVQNLQNLQRRSSYAGSGGTRRTTGATSTAALTTGHTTSFMNYSHYFSAPRKR